MSKEYISELVLTEVKRVIQNIGHTNISSPKVEPFADLPKTSAITPIATLINKTLSDQKIIIATETNNQIDMEILEALSEVEIVNVDNKDIETILIPTLSNADLALIADGSDASAIAKIITNGLLLGKEIIVLEEGIYFHNFIKTSHRGFYNMLRNKERSLATFGIKILNKQATIRLLQKKYSTSNSCDKFAGKVLTEDKIKQLHQDGSTDIKVTEKLIITPLAKDYIRANNIILTTVNR